VLLKIRKVVVLCLAACWIGVAGAGEPPPSTGAAARLLATQEATLKRAPGLRAAQEELAADVEATQAEAGAGTPYVELQMR